MTHRLLDRLEASHAHSVPGPVTSSPDGGLIFVAESGVLAVIDASVSSSFQTPKIAPISSLGVRAVELILDPEADFGGEDGANAAEPETVLYVAGGRMGLWLMQADPRTGQGMPAARIDDASDAGNASVQDSRYWCTDVDFFYHGGEWYLAALFAEWGCTRLRLYPLADARAVLSAHPGEETGNELEAAVEVELGGNCTYQTPRWEGFGLGMAIDSSEGTIYVALGPYGLMRVEFTDSTDLDSRVVTPGPWFGNGSYYASGTGGDPLYDDFELRGAVPGGSIEAQRSHAPFFCDLALQDDGEDKYLWAAVDHLGILAFDVTDPGDWSTSMSIKYHEGVPKDSSHFEIFETPQTDCRIPGFVAATVDDHVRLVAEDDDPDVGEPECVMVRNYAHRIRVANDADPPALAVAVGTLPIYISSHLNEGRTLSHLGQSEAGISENLAPRPLPRGAASYTLVYDLSVFPTGSPGYHYVALLRKGGAYLHLPEVQPQNELLVLGGVVDPRHTRFLYDEADPPDPPDPPTEHHTTFLVSLAWPSGGQIYQLERVGDDRPGRLCADVGSSLSNGAVLYTSGNDQGLATDGILALCDGRIVRVSFQPQGGTGSDWRGSFGILYHPESTWPDGTGHDYVWGVGKKENLGSVWMMTEMDPGEDVCDDPPTREPDRLKWYFVQAKRDNFGSLGRGYYSQGTVNLTYDAHADTEFLIATRHGSPAGGVALNRAVLQHGLTTFANDSATTEGFAHYRELLTHPEFSRVYYDDTQTNPPGNFLGNTGLAGRVQTYAPKFLEIPPPSESEDPDHWVLAFPCAAVQLPPDLPIFTSEPTWAPSGPFATYYDHSMVRVFDVHDGDVLKDDGEDIPSYTLIGPDPRSSAIGLDHHTLDDRSFLFVADLGGSVQVWELTSLLDEAPGRVVAPSHDDYGDFYFEEWLAPPCVSDDVGNNVRSVVLDRVTWNDGAGTRDELYVYVQVGRVGIAVLRFDPTQSFGQRLEQVALVEIPFAHGGLHIRHTGDPTARILLVGDGLAGIRAFAYGN